VLEVKGIPKLTAHGVAVNGGPDSTNNVAEYHGLIKGLEAAARCGVSDLKVFGDSNLVILQMRGKWTVHAANLVPLNRWAREVARQIAKVSYHWIPREENAEADALSKLGQPLLFNMGVVERASKIPEEAITQVDGKPLQYHVRGTGPEPYLVNVANRTCNCPVGERGRHCKHLARVVKLFHPEFTKIPHST
jgi:hypothetical protein